MTARVQKATKLLTLFLVSLAVFAISVLLPTQPVSAERDEVLDEIAAYRNWTKITKEPIQGPGIASITAVDIPVGGG